MFVTSHPHDLPFSSLPKLGPLDQLTLTAFLLAEFKVGVGEDTEERA